MKKNIILLIGILFCTYTHVYAEEAIGIVGRVYEADHPVIYKFVNELPEAEVRRELAWLTVISWKYDGSSNNGMPADAENQRMMILEETIEDLIAKSAALRHAYSRTGNDLKELVYYIHNRKEFLETFNQAMDSHARYPIEITFYKDKEWADLAGLINDFPQLELTK